MPHPLSRNPQVAAAQAENTGLHGRIRALADEVAEAAGFYVVGVQVRGQRGSRVLEVFVDGDAGIGTGDLASVSRGLGFLLDTEEVVSGTYYLNVSSPGADRPLVLPRQYRQHVGRPFEVTTEAGDERTVHTGTLAAVHTDHFEIDTGGATESIAFGDVTEARVRLPW